MGPRIPIVGGFAILIFALYGLSQLSLWSTVAFIFFFMCVKSVGQSSLNAPLNTVALAAIPEGRARMGSGMIGMTRGLGEAFSVAVLTFLIERHAFFNLYSIPPLQGEGLAGSERLQALSRIEGMLIGAGHYGLELGERARSLLAHTLIHQALNRAYQDLFFLIAILHVGLLIVALFLRAKRPQ